MGNNYTRAFKRLFNALNPVCKKYRKSKFFFLRDAAWAFLRYGVTPNEYIGFQFYRFSSLEKKRFFTARDQGRYEKKLNDYNYVEHFNLKHITNRTFSDFVKRDWLYLPEATTQSVENFLNNHTKFIVKPISLSSGQGIFCVSNDCRISFDEFNNMLLDKFGYSTWGGKHLKYNILIEEFIKQHTDISAINSSSVNTIRIYSIYNPVKDELIFLSAVLRVGNFGADVDNFHAGGIAYPINVEHGFVTGPGNDIFGNRHFFHPISNIKMIGFQIPNWNKLKSFVEKAARVVPQGRFIGWDIAVTPDGFELVEANYMADPGVMQSPTTEGCKDIILQYL